MNQDPNTPPENQDTADKTYAGKFKSIEEMEKAYLEAEKRGTKQAEDIDRLERFVSMMDLTAQNPPQVSPPTTVSDYTPVGEPIDADLERKIEAKINERITRVVSEKAQAEALEARFFTDNPDLKDEHELVTFHTAKYRTELGGRPVAVDRAMKEIAERVRAHLERIRKGSRTPPHLEGGSRGERQQSRNSEPQELSPEETLKDFINEERKRKTKLTTGKG